MGAPFPFWVSPHASQNHSEKGYQQNRDAHIDNVSGENQLGDNAAAALASLIHALPKLQSFTLAGNMIGRLVNHTSPRPLKHTPSNKLPEKA